ncbi:hypothetical protein FNU76_10740 [Chitinimonas arctica]|uniref:Uncharacterized protein n=1 Tax=Chitinimonas arctica TaxID=2594795 RepID=A0A516SF91_9NEIS|nr:hypothetical protein [Chitinimonas arctica]QDQ26802.1 hypothetical protein FNU76_10740 [Chitinimonas arctica]
MKKMLFPLLLVTASLGALAERGQQVELRVEDRYGRAYPEYHQRNRAWVAGEEGEPYQLRLRNLSRERVMVVLSVDGINAVSGETAAFRQSGYVLEPYADTVVTGWRKSMGSVARFYFTDLGDSYAARTDRPFDVGVIGAAVFNERRYVPPPAAIAKEGNRPPMASRKAESAAAMGTGHGEIEESHVRRTEFERASEQPREVLAVRYDSRRNLAAAGVITERRWRERARDQPSAFPREGFTPDPRW